MPGNEEHILDNLIQGSEALLRDIVTIGMPGGIERDIEEQEATSLGFLIIENGIAKADEVRCLFAIGTTEDEYGQ